MKNNSISWHYVGAQLIGWSSYLLFLLLSMYAFYKQAPNGIITLQGIITATLIVASHLMRNRFRSDKWQSYSGSNHIFRLVGFTFLVAVLSQIIIHLIIYVLIDIQGILPFNPVQSVLYTLNVFFILLIWAMIYLFFQGFQKRKRNELDNWKLKVELKEAELRILKSHINSHFLFNALNNIRSLILEDGNKARDMLSYLSDLLRFTMNHADHNQVSIQQELEIATSYLALQKIHFEDRLKYEINADDSLLDETIPPMTIQILLENSIKHGLSKSEMGGSISIRLLDRGDSIIVQVTNTGILENQRNKGIGWDVIHRRFAHDPNFDFHISQKSQDEILVEVHFSKTSRMEQD